MLARIRAWLVSGICLGALVSPAVAALQPENSDAEETILLYRPISYYKGGADSFTGKEVADIPAERVLSRLLAQLEQPVVVRYLPLKRAISQYGASRDDCIVAPRNGEGEPDVVSDVFYASPFWIYVLNDSPVQSHDNISTFGTIDGADMMTGKVLFGATERTFAPNFQSLIAMLLSGRVEAIPLGELALSNEPDLAPKVRRLSDEPYVTIDMRIRCKRTARNELFVSMVNGAIHAREGTAADE